MLGRVLPHWFVLVATLAFAKGLVALGLVVLMRGGLVSFGQGIFFCAGGYAAGLAMRSLGVTDAVLLVALGGALALLLGLIIAPLLAGYRGIFFATLTLALSMIAYGILDKTYSLGGSDGLNLQAPTFLTYQPQTSQEVSYALFVLASLLTAIAAALCRIHFDSIRGLLSLAARDNEIRVEYLGASVRWVSGTNFIICGPARRHRRRAGRALARPHRPRFRVLDDVGRVRLPRDPERVRERDRRVRRRRAPRTRALVLQPIFPQHLARARSAYFSCSSFCSCRTGLGSLVRRRRRAAVKPAPEPAESVK